MDQAGGIELHCPIGALPRLVGPLAAASIEVLAAHTTVVGVRFWPGAASSLLGLPADELVDLTVRPDEVWRDAALRLGELLAAAPGPDAALELSSADADHKAATGHLTGVSGEVMDELMTTATVVVAAGPSSLPAAGTATTTTASRSSC